LLRELPEIRGYAVTESCNGEEALAVVEQTPYTLLLDIGMPLLDGFAVVRTPSGKSALRFAAGWGIWPGLSARPVTMMMGVDLFRDDLRMM
jgi:CheY-like chemotaxis protein